jgi:hypothetical protein
MPTNTYVALDKVTAGASTSSITFSSIPQGYTDLVLVFNGAHATTAEDFQIQVNSDTGSNYSRMWLTGTGSAAASGRASTQTYMRINQNAYLGTAFAYAYIVQFMNYSNATTFKTVLSRANGQPNGVDASVNLWRSTAAITSIYCYTPSGNFATGSTFTLYGIKAESFAAKATGGTITYSAGYWYHAFTSSGTFAPTQALTCDALVIAGGGGGSSGGGGAGGLRYFASEPFAVSSYTVTVGGGGATGTASTDGVSGSNSQVGSLTVSTGGGGAGDVDGSVGLAGGSGGGGGASDPTGFAGGAASPSGQGSAGGNGFARADGDGGGGGGGGAGGAGSNATRTAAGNGGAGVNTYSTFATATSTGVSGFYAGGGGGGANVATRGTGGSGGGGNGQRGTPSTAGSAGTANTGSGGGANYASANSYPGGSGIVIIRYAN